MGSSGHNGCTRVVGFYWSGSLCKSEKVLFCNGICFISKQSSSLTRFFWVCTDPHYGTITYDRNISYHSLHIVRHFIYGSLACTSHSVNSCIFSRKSQGSVQCIVIFEKASVDLYLFAFFVLWACEISELIPVCPCYRMTIRGLLQFHKDIYIYCHHSCTYITHIIIYVLLYQFLKPSLLNCLEVAPQQQLFVLHDKDF